jgi:hypothetical protein
MIIRNKAELEQVIAANNLESHRIGTTLYIIDDSQSTDDEDNSVTVGKFSLVTLCGEIDDAHLENQP